jgi:hypothetical protein
MDSSRPRRAPIFETCGTPGQRAVLNVLLSAGVSSSQQPDRVKMLVLRQVLTIDVLQKLDMFRLLPRSAFAERRCQIHNHGLEGCDL